MEPWLVSWRNRIIFNHCPTKKRLDPWMALRITFHREFSHLTRALEHCADSNSIPQDQLTIFHPNPSVIVLVLFLLLFSVQLSHQYRSSQIDEALKFEDSMIDLHTICQIPTSCECKWLSAFLTARETFVNSFPSSEKFYFCTDRIESIE